MSRPAKVLNFYEMTRNAPALRSIVSASTVRVEWFSSELSCGLCGKIMRNTTILRKCLHRFCAACINTWIGNGNKKCSKCDVEILKKNPLKSDPNFDAIIEKFLRGHSKTPLKRPLTESPADHNKKRPKCDGHDLDVEIPRGDRSCNGGSTSKVAASSSRCVNSTLGTSALPAVIEAPEIRHTLVMPNILSRSRLDISKLKKQDLNARTTKNFGTNSMPNSGDPSPKKFVSGNVNRGRQLTDIPCVTFPSTSSLEQSSPRPSEYVIPRRKILSDNDVEVILTPDASLVNDYTIPFVVRRPRYIVTLATSFVGHLRRFILRRIAMDAPYENVPLSTLHTWTKKQLLLYCVQQDVPVDDIFILKETGAGQYTTVNVCENKADPQLAYVFMISRPASRSFTIVLTKNESEIRSP